MADASNEPGKAPPPWVAKTFSKVHVFFNRLTGGARSTHWAVTMCALLP